MLATTVSAATFGVDAYLVQVEVSVSRGGMFNFIVVGLPDAAVKESTARVGVAVRSQGYTFPHTRILVNLAPADVKKEGAAFDLPIALGVIAASGQIDELAPLNQFVITGELSLEGTLRPVPGVLPMVIAARDAGKRGVILPAENAREAAVVKGVEIYPVNSIREAIDVLVGLKDPIPTEEFGDVLQQPNWQIDFHDVRGQAAVKRALEVAAAGGHNVLMQGPPGSGKTMLARRLATILPPLAFEEALEVTKLYSITGQLGKDRALITERPFRSPHHTVSDAGLIGGGSVPRPGEISLSHHGVLFLDELPEFRREVLEVMRQPLEEGFVTISRAAAAITYPARCLFVGAMNPCPCGYRGDSAHNCTCDEMQIRRYRRKISGPLLDRVDIQIEVPRLKHEELLEPPAGEPSAAIRERVCTAREVQQQRLAGSGALCNAAMNSKQIRQFCRMDAASETLLKGAIQRLGLSARAYDRVLKLSRTIADLDGQEAIGAEHVMEAIQCRTLDRPI